MFLALLAFERRLNKHRKGLLGKFVAVAAKFTETVILSILIFVPLYSSIFFLWRQR